MQKRAIGWVLSGVFFATIGVVSAAGCSSPRGECESVCYRACDVSERCEDYIQGDFDVAKCRNNCAEDCDDYFDAKEIECDNGIETNATAVNACHESLDELTNACANDDGAKALQNLIEVGNNCQVNKGFSCK